MQNIGKGAHFADAIFNSRDAFVNLPRGLNDIPNFRKAGEQAELKGDEMNVLSSDDRR
jgi:hypothetical protein